MEHDFLVCTEHPYTEHVGVEIPAVYDGVLYWYCPHSGLAWPRFIDGGRLTESGAHYAMNHMDHS